MTAPLSEIAANWIECMAGCDLPAGIGECNCIAAEYRATLRGYAEREAKLAEVLAEVLGEYLPTLAGWARDQQMHVYAGSIDADAEALRSLTTPSPEAEDTDG